MRSLGKLVGCCLLAAAGFALALMGILASVMLAVGWHEYRNYPYASHSIGTIADALQRTGDGYRLDPACPPEEWLNGYVWAMQLDDGGHVVWQYGLPDELNKDYTVSEVAGFTRWYLGDYPVFTWRNAYGIMVLAKPEGSVWKYNYYSTPDAVVVAVESAGKAVLCVLLAAGVVCGVLLHRFWRRLRQIGAGIDALARGQPLTVPVDGITAELAKNLNRTGEILHRQNEMLARRDAARTDWIAGVSHDIRTPLALIVGYAEQLEPDGKAEQIRFQAQKIKTLVEDLNLTSKLQYKAQPLRRSPVTVGSLLRKAAADFCNSVPAERYPLEFHMTEQAGPLVLDGDAALLSRALENLWNNAVRHNPGGCHVLLRGERVDDNVVLTVEDDGGGYPAAVLAALQTGTAGDNTPHILGLHLVERIISVHGGTAWFGQNQPHGAKAVLTLPVRPQEPAASPNL